MDIEQIDFEMQYSPPWYKDRSYFVGLLNSHQITDEQLIILARLYIRYSHMDESASILYALDTILRKFNLVDKQILFKKTRDLYMKEYTIKKKTLFS